MLVVNSQPDTIAVKANARAPLLGPSKSIPEKLSNKPEVSFLLFVWLSWVGLEADLTWLPSFLVTYLPALFFERPPLLLLRLLRDREKNTSKRAIIGGKGIEKSWPPQLTSV